MNENQNQTTPEKKGILEQLKGIGLLGYLCICVVAKAVVEIVRIIAKK